MRNYGKIESGFWQNPKMRQLSESGRLLLIYLFSCQHGNSIGCFVLHDGYIAADLGWSSERVSEHVSELVSKGHIERDETTFLTRIIGWFGHNTIENLNVAKAAIKTIKSIHNCEIKDNLLKELNSLRNKFINEYRNELVNEYLNPEQQQQPEPEPEPNLNLSQNQRQEPETSGARNIFEKNDFGAAAAFCASLIGKRKLADYEKEQLTVWLMKYDFEKTIKPILTDGLESYMKKYPGKRPASLTWFTEKVREKA